MSWGRWTGAAPSSKMEAGRRISWRPSTSNNKNFPDSLHRRLRVLAKREHRSLAQEVIHLLSQAVEGGEETSVLELKGLGKELWERIDPGRHVEEERASWE